MRRQICLLMMKLRKSIECALFVIAYCTYFDVTNKDSVDTSALLHTERKFIMRKLNECVTRRNL